MIDRQNEVQALSGPTLDEAIARMHRAGLAGHEIAQSLILTGAGLLAGALGPKGAGYDLRAVADATRLWIESMATAVEQKEVH